MRTRSIRPVAAFAALALAGSVLAFSAPAAQAAPVFVDADTNLEPFSGAYTYSGGCTTVETPSTNTDVPVLENGPTVSASPSVTATATNPGDITDNAASAASSTVSTSVKSAGGHVSQINLDMNGQYIIDTSLATSACNHYVYAGADTEFQFVVTTPVFMHLNFKSTAGTYSEVYLYQVLPSGPTPYYDHYGRGLKFSGTDTVYIPAGTYDGYFEAEVSQGSFTDKSGIVSASAHATFTLPGSQTEGVSGKGKKYVTYPATRSCATHALVPNITKKKKRANQIKDVTFFVNDAKVKKVKTPNKGQAVTLPIADDVAAEVVAKVKLFPKKKGKPAKVVEVRAAYEACS